MKKIVECEESFCDFCGHSSWYSCLKCQRDFCYNCMREGLAVEYSYGVIGGGTGDGRYCKECDTQLRASRSDSLHCAYLQIEALKVERQNWHDNFSLRADLAEAELQRLQSL